MPIVTTASPSIGTDTGPLEQLTAPALWRYAVGKALEVPAYLEEQADGWRPVSWPEADERIEAIGGALLARGVRKGDAVAVLARTRLEWLLLDWAIMSIGAVVVGIYPTSSAAETRYILEHSETVLTFVEDEAQLEKVRSVHDGPVVRFADFLEFEAEGRAYDGEPAEPPREDDLATLIYTSGTTGPPKGCMLTHRTLVPAATRASSSSDMNDVVLLFLPMAHSFARIAHQGSSFNGAAVALVTDVARVPEAMQKTRP